MSFIVAPIVEGYGDVEAVPLLIRRICPWLTVKKPVRIPRNRLIKPEQLERAALIAASNITDRGGVLLVMDADEDCAAKLGPELERQLSNILPHRLCRVVLIVRKFEAWIVGGHPEFGITNPDQAGDLKGRIRSQFGVYKVTVDQRRLIAAANLESLMERSRSFRRLRKVLDEFST